jgi:S-adenosylmethionine-diacylglycerol 3-amino-3-carboxypropyl transferase
MELGQPGVQLARTDEIPATPQPQRERRGSDRLSRAVHRNKRLSQEGFRERLFTLAFRGLVYPQIWEDPRIDLEALEIQPDSHVVTIASGGCNVLSYLIANPAHITALDLNHAHIALNQLKLTAAKHLPDYASFYRFFGEANSRANVAAYTKHIAPHLPETARDYWEARDLLGRRRVNFFTRNIYRYGLLGSFIGAGHLLCRLHGRDPRRILQAQTMEQQREIFDRELASLFDKRHVRWLLNRPILLYGLGIPPSQRRELTACADGDLAKLLKERLARLACDFDLDDNYFAWQAFNRRYGASRAATPTPPTPPYLEAGHFGEVRERADRVQPLRMSYTEFLAGQPNSSADRYILLDAQDWMTDQQLTELWREITRTARPGARVIFRTAGERTILPGRVPPETLDRWTYDEARSAALGARDRSSVYGGFHLYVLREPLQ